jgi:hypothetical protein
MKIQDSLLNSIKRKTKLKMYNKENRILLTILYHFTYLYILKSSESLKIGLARYNEGWRDDLNSSEIQYCEKEMWGSTFAYTIVRLYAPYCYHVLVTRHVVWIGNWIYQTVITRNYR